MDRFPVFASTHLRIFMNGAVFPFACLVISGGTPYDGLYGEAPLERGTFFRIPVYER